MSNLAERALMTLAHEHDLNHPEEEPRGSNWGPYPEKYLAAVGIHSPAAWCLAVLMWSLLESGATSANLPEPNQRASACSFKQWANRTNRIVSEPDRADYFARCDATTWKGHAGQIAEVKRVVVPGWYDLGDGKRKFLLSGKWLRTLEGNADPAGGREGYALMRRFRRITPDLSFIRI